eukprot:TRINITY_DN88376_c1_g1_i1.p1 TRINITY_DN88376_c1_g1~~TRINITY_DN88376_c1_g1_i1.p1  ORF type:complete len:841 (+),score=76.53 TRINITY_DN88376_c1_g1_i1:279-2525(+)
MTNMAIYGIQYGVINIAINTQTCGMCIINLYKNKSNSFQTEKMQGKVKTIVQYTPREHKDSVSSEINEEESEPEPEEELPIRLDAKHIVPPETATPSETVPSSIQKDTHPTSYAETEKKTEKEHKPLKLIANVLHTQYEVVKEVLKKKFRCKLSTEEEGEWDILWADTGVNSTMIAKLRPYQKINHYHGMSCLARKNHLGRNLMRLRKVLPEDYNYFPPTWLLPTDWNEFKGQVAGGKKTFILKPEALSQGKGIFLTNSLEGISLDQKYVAQRYISKPYLIDGLKFDLRIYVLVYGCDPLRIFIFKEGLARLATEAYVPPVGENIENLYVHLTNYAINKNSENFVFNTDSERADIGHKRSLTFLWEYIDKHGGDSTKLREEIKDCIVKTLCAVQPLLSHSYRSCQPNDHYNNKCFEILGFDILLDHKLKPWLLEVNHSPSFTTDTPFDHKIKTELLTDALNIVKLNSMKRQKYYQTLEDKKGKIKLIKDKHAKPTKEEIAELRKKNMAKRDKHELEHSGGFTRIYPELELGVNTDPTLSKYDKYLKAAQGVWDEFTGAKRRKELIKKKADIVEKQQKKRLIKPKSTYSGPIHRKPLYYVKSDRPPRPKHSEDPFLGNEFLAEILRDAEMRRMVMDRLSGNNLEEYRDREVVEKVVEKLMELHKDPLQVIEQYFSQSQTDAPYIKMKDKMKKKPLVPGAFLVPKIIELAPAPVLEPISSQKNLANIDIHKLWRWKKSQLQQYITIKIII